MRARSLMLLSCLAVVAGCRDKPPSGGSTTTVATTATAAESAAPSATVTATASASATATARPPRTWSFDKDQVDEPPAGFELVKVGGKAGKWVVKAEKQPFSAPNVLAQLDGDRTDGRFAMAIASDSTARDARVSVRCRMVSGKVDRACGVVARFKDEKNYYLGRVNGLEKDVNLYVVKDGKRQKLGGWKGATIGDAWHEIVLEAKGDHLALSWDGTRIFEATDKTFADAGRAGLWIKADSVTHFDELAVTSFD